MQHFVASTSVQKPEHVIQQQKSYPTNFVRKKYHSLLFDLLFEQSLIYYE